MDFNGKHVLVTGANRGLGRALTQAALAAGASKVYGAARDASAVDVEGVTAVQLDVTDHAAVAALASELTAVDVVINNAGVANVQFPLAADLDVARRELEVNYLGTAAVVQAFAPVLAARGGGAIANVLSVASWIGSPALSTYAASKAAAWAYTNAVRIELRQQGTQVTGVFFSFMDTDMAAGFDVPKLSPEHVAEAIIAGIAANQAEVIVDELSQGVKASLADDQKLLYPGIEAQYLEQIGAAA